MVLGIYVVKEHLLPILFAFAVIMLLLVLDTMLQAADMILGRGVSVRVAAELFFLHTAWQIALAVPMSILVGSLMAFGRLSGDNEIAAMRALGVGFHQLLWPALALAVVVALALVWFNDRVLPDFRGPARRAWLGRLRAARITPARRWAAAEFSMNFVQTLGRKRAFLIPPATCT